MQLQILGILIGAFTVLWLGAHYYGRSIERKLGVDAARPTPAHTQGDGRDFLPSSRGVLFAHHFAAIAGAGPIIGPTLALAYGIGPVLFWVLLGAVFLGGVQDFAAAIMSVRQRGESIALIARRLLGPAGYAGMVGFLLIGLCMINATFLNLSIKALTSVYAAEKVGLPARTSEELKDLVHRRYGEEKTARLAPGEILVLPLHEETVMPTQARVENRAGKLSFTQEAKIGGIASTSVLIITALAPLLGWMLYRARYPSWITYPLAALICLTSVGLGLLWPVSVPEETWRGILVVYVLLASSIPVWLLLMPRDFINVQILYGGMAVVFAALLWQGLSGGGPTASASSPNADNVMGWWYGTDGVRHVGQLWPLMFITVSCGAISGFHCLVCTGTTAKQLSSEGDARRVVYQAMLLESLLAVSVILTITAGLSRSDYLQITYLHNNGNPVLAIALATGNLLHQSFHLPVWAGTVLGILLLEGFVVTTLDASVRLSRYLLEELWKILLNHPPTWLVNPWTNTLLVVATMYFLSQWNTLKVLWMVFGSANQMMGALALLLGSLWLREQKRRCRFTLLPCMFMFATTLTSTGMALQKNLQTGNLPLILACCVMIALAVGMIMLAVRRFRELGPLSQ